MTVKNLKGVTDASTQLMTAFKDNDENSFGEAMVALSSEIQDRILKEAQTTNQDQLVLMNRGQRVLTSQETKYYNEVVNNDGFAGVEELVPATIFERVFEDLENSHPLLQKITFVNTTGVTEWIISRGVNPAWWGKLCEEIKKVLDNGFDTINMKQFKLSAYIPVCKAMLELGPIWLDRYIRTVLVESLRIGLEQAIVDGTGKDMPVGMMRDMSSQTNGEHPQKAAEEITTLDATTMGGLMARLTEINIDGVTDPIYRTINPSDVLMIVNPFDYWAKVFPAKSVLADNGQYVQVLPVPVSDMQSVAVPKGKAVFGLASDYFMGIGSTLKIEESDEYHFVEDERIYLGKQLANGQPKRNDSFIVLDISKLGAAQEPETPPTP
ncbi:phage major capsid protein [Candidatus Enterococcus murrayae]|uniref:Phage major capsid protein n=1 Tax=Candidatus Enterococcus murrayae TaxID=2815321 RepID=A0ABS3HBC0_9ENTE|nr:phage major capsid protein [Enterococcus sp. MJM16]MBO0450760.1 phage major capsid protein [Enterococcus sp. MJM16]